MIVLYKTSISFYAFIFLGSPFFGQKKVFATATQPYAYVADINATYVGITTQSASEKPVDVDEFLGIKFATQERFEQSEVMFDPIDDDHETTDYVVESDDGLLINATTRGPTCAQPAATLPEGAEFSEDCLYLDIYRPSTHSEEDEDPLPVMIWIHGGSFTQDNEPWDFTTLVGNKNVILVAIKYRLSIFGNLANDIDGTGGMNGILDQVEALKWIQQRISSFGGDPDSITVFGESAGAISICFLSVMEQAKGLYRRSIMESRSCITGGYSYRNSEKGFDRVKEILQNTKCASPPCEISDLKNLPTEELMKSNYTIDFVTNDNAIFPILPIEMYKTKGRIVPQDMIVGANTFDSTLPYGKGNENCTSSCVWTFTNLEDVSEEIKNAVEAAYSPDLPMYNGSTFAAIHQAIGDIDGLCFIREHAAIASSMMDGNVYTYLFGHLPSFDPYIGNGYQNSTRKVAPNFDDSTLTSHGMEVPFVFGYGGPEVWATPLSEEIMSRWANFARFGDPNPPISPSSAESLYEMWETVSNDVNVTNNDKASDTRYLYLTVDGGSMIESNKVKTGQCTAAIQTNPYFSKKNSESVAPFAEGETEAPLDSDDSASAASAGFHSEFGVALFVIQVVAAFASVSVAL